MLILKQRCRYAISMYPALLHILYCLFVLVYWFADKYILSVHLSGQIHSPPNSRSVTVRPSTFSSNYQVFTCQAKCILNQIFIVHLSENLELLIYSDLDIAMSIASILIVLYFLRPSRNVLNLTNVWPDMLIKSGYSKVQLQIYLFRIMS